MKIRYMLLSALLMTGSAVYAQKFSATTTMKMLNHRASESRLKSESTGMESFGAFVRVADEEAIAQMEKLGAKLQGRISDNLVTMTIPVSALRGIANIEGVENVQAGSDVHLLMDEARTDGKVDKCHTATATMPAYTGKGVVVGIVDNGFQYDHSNFLTSDKTASRIKRIWNQNSSAGNAPAAFGYGTEYTNYEEIKAARYDMTSTYHATHVTGIAAGSDKSTQYYGVAPDADLVLVSFNSSTTDIVNGIKYVFDYAESVGKPAVVNISIGSHVGSHDGKSATDIAFDELAGPGRIIVGAAGNEGSDALHASKTLTADDDQMKVMFAYSSSSSSTYKNAYVDIWGSPNTDIKVKTVIVDAAKGKIVAESPEVSCSGTTDVTYTFPEGNGVVASVQMAAAVDENNGRPDVILMCRASEINEYRKIGIVVTGPSGSTVHAWNCGSYSTFVQTTKKGWTSGDTDYTVGEIGGVGQSVISVGSHNTKMWYQPLSLVGTEGGYSVNPAVVGYQGERSLFSSVGPTLDGRMKPDVTAPGCMVISSVSKYYSSLDTDAAAAKSGDDYYDANVGTSMASPFVAGTVALWLQADPTLTPARVREIIAATAAHDSYTGTTPDNKWGYGKIDAYAGLQKVLETSGIEDVKAQDDLFEVVTDRDARTATVRYAGESACVEVYNMLGEKVFGTELQMSGETLSLSSLPAGVYVFKLTNGSKTHTMKTLF